MPVRLIPLKPVAGVLASALLCALSGCGSLYLHNDAAAKATSEAKTELDKVNVTALFDNEEAYLNDLEKRENAAVAEQFSAWRDEQLLEILRGLRPLKKDGDGRHVLALLVDLHLQAIVGRSDLGSGVPKLSEAIKTSHGNVVGGMTLADALQNNIQPLPPAAGRLPTGPNGGLTLHEAIAAVKQEEEDLKAKESAAKAAKEELSRELKKAGEELAAGNTSQAAFTEIVTKVNKLLADAKAGTAEANPYIGQLISESLLEKVDHLIEVTSPEGLGNGAATDSQARAALGFIHAAFGVGDAFANPPRVPQPNALAATKAQLNYAAAGYAAELAQAQAKLTVLRARLAAAAQQVYYLSLAGAALEPLGSKPALRDDEGLAKLLVGNDSERDAATQALYYYAAAWTKGVVPAQQLGQVALPFLERRSKLQRSRQAGEAWLGTLNPALATLVAYGEGGIDPHLIAELLQMLGITAIAAGVN